MTNAADMGNAVNNPLGNIATEMATEAADVSGVAAAAGVPNPGNVAVRNLTIRLGSNTVIENLDLDVRAGEFVVLLGPSGCGKSTLLHSIAGLIDVSAGPIEIGGGDMTLGGPKGPPVR